MNAGPFGPGIRRICAVAAARTAAEMIAQVRAGLRETPTIELRLDWLKSDAERARMLVWVAKRYGGADSPHGFTAKRRGSRKGIAERPVFIATCRRVAGGGKFRGSVEAELAWLARAREAGCGWCDLEVESAHELARHRTDSRVTSGTQDPGVKTAPGARDVSETRSDGHGQPVPVRRLGRVMVSVHDFRGTADLGRAVGLKVRIAERGGTGAGTPGIDLDAVKIAALANTIRDSARVLRAARRVKNCVAVPMGEVGLPGRILALREGSGLAYAPIAEATAPGQVSLWQLKHLYRAHELNRQTQVYGVIGNPVGHSLSPLMHNTGFIARKVNAVYLPFLVEDLRDFLKAAPEFGVRGFSVTLPHKTSISRFLDECDPLAAEIGAVNTVIVRADGSLYGCNTDYVGVLRALQRRFRIAGSRALIFGAGGAARAAAFALARAGADVVVCARREEAARDLARAVGADVVPRRALRTERFDAIINTTPVGMYPHDEISPLDARELHCRIAMDLINRPQHTKFLKLAASKGIATVLGIDMFVPQGVAQWEMWIGQRAPEAAMRRAVVNALRAEAKGEAKERRPR